MKCEEPLFTELCWICVRVGWWCTAESVKGVAYFRLQHTSVTDTQYVIVEWYRFTVKSFSNVEKRGMKVPYIRLQHADAINAHHLMGEW